MRKLRLHFEKPFAHHHDTMRALRMLVGASVLIGTGCSTRLNPDFCRSNDECADGFVCDLSRNRCDAIDQSPDGGSGDAPSRDAPPAGRCNPAAAFGAPTLVPGINSSQDELSFAMTGDELTAFLTVSVPAGGYTLKKSTRADAGEAFPAPDTTGLSAMNAEAGLELRPYPMPSGSAIYFERSELRVAERNLDASYTAGSRVYLDGAPVSGYAFNPQISADTNTLYYYSDKMYAMTRSADTEYFTQRRPAATFGVDAFVVSADELELYYARSPDFDVFVSKRTAKQDPFEPGTIVSNVNSNAVDLPVFVSSDGCFLYIQSLRPGGLGSGDIWVAKRGI